MVSSTSFSWLALYASTRSFACFSSGARVHRVSVLPSSTPSTPPSPVPPVAASSPPEADPHAASPSATRPASVVVATDLFHEVPRWCVISCLLVLVFEPLHLRPVLALRANTFSVTVSRCGALHLADPPLRRLVFDVLASTVSGVLASSLAPKLSEKVF
ncbi:Uncharacterised protein [Mycobacteroides abscessus]|nr:Uncharacterised protein [Mycobacteroides abscessus]